MLRLQNSKHSDNTILFFWFLMAFQAGYVNTGGFITAMSFVSHVTGFGTLIGYYVAQRDMIMFAEMLSIPLSFIGGAFFSSYFISRKQELGQEPNQLLILTVKSLIFLLVLVGGITGLWGAFEDKAVHEAEFFLIPLLCFACGIQNSTCAQLTGGFLKPTHLTGLSTDIGINFGRLIALKQKKDPAYKEELKRNLIRVGIFFSFATGAAVSYGVFENFQYYAFAFPFLVSALFLFMGILDKFHAEHRLKYIRIGESVIFIVFLVFLFLPFSSGVMS